MNRPVRTALVTGAAQGIGASIAAKLVEAGVHVCLGDINPQAVQETATKLRSIEGSTTWVELDVTDPASIDLAWEHMTAHHGGVDILVNCAAITPRRGASLFDVAPDDWDLIMATNLKSVFYVTKRFVPSMKRGGWGRVVNMSSLAGQQGGSVAAPHYAASKAGILLLTKMMAAELAPYGITVNAVAPGPTRTPAMDLMPADRLADALARIPMGRFGTSEEVGALVAHLCGEDAGFITGATFDINGGLLAR